MEIFDFDQIHKASGNGTQQTSIGNIATWDIAVATAAFTRSAKGGVCICTPRQLDTISYPLFVHAIRENVNGSDLFTALCHTNPNH